MSSNKHYGLHLPLKNSVGLVKKHSAFGEDSDSEKSDGGSTDWAKRALKATEKSTIKRQTKIEMQRAVDEDTTVYQYDEIYDQMQKSKQDKVSKEREKKPKYIEKLMAAAERRKIENERRIEKQVQKERDAEGDEFKDKETFVTSAYKKKLEEFAKLDAEQKRQDMLEEIGDVTKQQDISGFYRHLYQTKVDGAKEESPSKSANREVNSSPKKESKKSDNAKHSHARGSSKDILSSKAVKEDKDSSSSIKKVDSKKDNRTYRKRKDSGSSADKTKDADTDVGSSSSSSSSSSDSESGEDKSSQSESENPKRLLSKRYSNEQAVPVEQSSTNEPVPVEAIIPEINIWEKRTVGPVFDAALKRYLERKSAKLTVVS